jgi:tol-pal system protein YbgF
MKRLWKRSQAMGFVGCGFGLLLLTACVTTQEDVMYLNDQIVALNKRVDKMQESMDAKIATSDLDTKLESVRGNQAEASTERDAIRSEIQALSGRVEENRHLIKRGVERDTMDGDATQTGMTDLAPRIAQLEQDVQRLYAYLGIQTRTSAKEGEPTEVPGEGQKPAQQPENPEKEPVSPEQAHYEATLTDYREERYEEALEGFRGFLEKYPKSDLADNAQFWIGESYMSLQEYEQAILSYQAVIKNYPKGNKVPNAMLRQALAFYELKDKTSARLLLKKLIRNFPNSSEAKIAQAKLKTIK